MNNVIGLKLYAWSLVKDLRSDGEQTDSVSPKKSYQGQETTDSYCPPLHEPSADQQERTDNTYESHEFDIVTIEDYRAENIQIAPFALALFIFCCYYCC